MGKTYKDREAQGRPRVPEWARPKPTKPHKLKDKDDPKVRNDEFNGAWVKEEWDRY